MVWFQRRGMIAAKWKTFARYISGVMKHPGVLLLYVHVGAFLDAICRYEKPRWAAAAGEWHKLA
jgi:hypothetical protein